MTALIRRTPLRALLRTHGQRRTRPAGYIGERRAGAKRRCPSSCRCGIRYARGAVMPTAAMTPTRIMPIIRGGQ